MMEQGFPPPLQASLHQHFATLWLLPASSLISISHHYSLWQDCAGGARLGKQLLPAGTAAHAHPHTGSSHKGSSNSRPTLPGGFLGCFLCKCSQVFNWQHGDSSENNLEDLWLSLLWHFLTEKGVKKIKINRLNSTLIEGKSLPSHNLMATKLRLTFSVS